MYALAEDEEESSETLTIPEEFERLSQEKIDSYCPISGNPNLVSICGSVRQATPQSKNLRDGSSSPSASQVPVKGVSVYLYECDNTSPTCKRDGFLVHPFSSTSTNKDGLFHLVGRKLDNNWDLSYIDQYADAWDRVENNDTTIKEVTVTNQSRKRYLIFKCGNFFQGIHIIPSYIDITGIIHEVNCPIEYLPENEEEFSYKPPYFHFDFIGGVKLAAQMGIDEEDPYYPLQRGEHVDENNDGVFEGIENTIQAHYEKYSNQKNQSVKIILTGADQRFTTPEHTAGKKEALETSLILPLETKVPTKGAWYFQDCLIQYEEIDRKFGTNYRRLCVNGNGVQRDEYEKALYSRDDFLSAQLLPSLPPRQAILYYRPLEVRNEISAYYQDQDDIAKFLGTMFSNCVGDVYKRKWEQTPKDEEKPTYPNCELLKQCNRTVNINSNISSLTSNGPVGGMMSPTALDGLQYETDPDIPVCLIAGEEEPVLLGQIQRPGQISCGGNMRLCEDGAYWNNYYLTNLGNNNRALTWGLSGENESDSYERKLTDSGEPVSDGTDINSLPFQRDLEGSGNPNLGGQKAVASQGDRSGNNSGKAIFNITSSGTGASSTEKLTDFLAQPYEKDGYKKEDSFEIPYYISTRPVAWGQFSKTNSYPENIITSGSQDSEYLDPYAFNTEMECESCGDEHYPEDLKKNRVEVKGGRLWGGSRTPFQAIVSTTAAENRMVALRGHNWGDNFDSRISIATGHSYIDWGLLRVKDRPTILDAITRILSNFFRYFRGEETKQKTFSDRVPTGIISDSNIEFKTKDTLVAYGFKVNANNFEYLFECPERIEVGQWGTDHDSGCYPWHTLNSGEKCNTAATCTVKGIGADVKVSRTCRVNECYKGTLTITYNCMGSGMVNELSRASVNTGDCSPVVAQYCAVNQTGWSGPNGINPITTIVPAQACAGVDLAEKIFTGYYDYCTVARAGPNECDGDILVDSEIKVRSQNIDDQDDLNSPESFIADEIPDAGLSLYESFKDPYVTNINPLPASWVSVSSSLSNTEPDVSLRKDFPGIGSGSSFLTRAQFGQPYSRASSQLEPLYIHCQNSDLGTEGFWDDGEKCDFQKLPNPEIIKIETLENQLESLEDPPCMLKDDITACEELVLGYSESGEPLKFSETFKLILNLAGNKFGVEPAAILTYMHKVGADKKYKNYWSEEGEKKLQQASLPWYGSFPFCDDLEPVEQPPFEWKLVWFSEMFKSVSEGSNSPYAELENLSPGRGSTAGRCNFIDSIYTLTSAIALNLAIKDDSGNLIKDISCLEQNWDNLMKNSIKIQFYQIGLNKDRFRGSVKLDNTLEMQEYVDIWNACK